MGKKLRICNGSSCKKAGSVKLIKKWAKELKIKYKTKSCDCLGMCKSGYAVKFKGKTHSCVSKSGLSKFISNS
jgi:NADH:ubiquinone oxidoreductase subunit E